MKVVFIGQNPSSDNSYPDTAFVGSRSYATLIGWLVKLGLKEKDVTAINASKKLGKVTRNDIDELGILSIILQTDIKIICLGEYAETAVIEVAYRHKICDIDMFTLPHPSGLNRKLNDKKQLDTTLKHCREWLEMKYE